MKRSRTARRGTNITIEFPDGSHLRGWLYHGDYLTHVLGGRLVALDREGKELRFVTFRHGEWSSVHIGGGEYITFPEDAALEQIDELEETIERPMRDALDRLDYNELKRLAEAHHHLASRAARQRWYINAAPEVDTFVETALVAKTEYLHLLAQLKKSRISDLMVTHAERLSKAIAANTLPGIDADVVDDIPDPELQTLFTLYLRLREHERLIELDCGEALVQEITTDRLLEVHRYAAERTESFVNPKQSGAGHEPNKPGPVWPTAVKRTAAIGRLATGGSFVAANLGLGSIVGVVSTLPTLTLGSVAAVIAIATSCYTGRICLPT